MVTRASGAKPDACSVTLDPRWRLFAGTNRSGAVGLAEPGFVGGAAVEGGEVRSVVEGLAVVVDGDDGFWERADWVVVVAAWCFDGLDVEVLPGVVVVVVLEEELVEVDGLWLATGESDQAPLVGELGAAPMSTTTPLVGSYAAAAPLRASEAPVSASGLQLPPFQAHSPDVLSDVGPRSSSWDVALS